MTTVLSKPKVFVSVDSRWTDVFDKPMQTQMRKHIYANNEITLFSGDHLPILLEQAILLEVIEEDDYIRFIDNLDREETFGYITFDADDGSFVEDNNYSYEWHYGCSHTGTGGYHAAQFYYHAHKRNYKSVYGCNIEGAMRYAFYRDICSGDDIYKKTWGDTPIDTTLNTDAFYKQFLQTQISRYFRGYGMEKIKSAMRTSGGSRGERVSVASAQERLANRKKRLLDKAKAN